MADKSFMRATGWRPCRRARHHVSDRELLRTGSRRRALRVINTQPPVPLIQYFAVHRTGEISPLGAIVAGIARDCCDFSVRRFS
jgi:hypothetical protein